ncbi:MAG TPA: hypothetical protein VMW95_02315, partial [Desulfobacterales bacterium]|nr:hypothetical protein [Desulfobacterales bacterium]
MHIFQNGEIKIAKLDSDKIMFFLERKEQTKTWLAKELGFSRQRLQYILDCQTTAHLKKIAKVLGVKQSSLLIAV